MAQHRRRFVAQKWLDDIAAMRAAANDLENWFGELRSDAARLLYLADKPGERVALPWPVWQEQLGKLLTQAEAPPHRPSDRLPNTKVSPSAKQSLTYETVLSLAEVMKAQKEWDDDRQKLLMLRDLTQMLGLVPETAERRALLKLPELPTAEDIRDRVAVLQKQFPRAVDWSVAKLPDAVAPDIRAAAQVSYDRLINFGRNIVLRALQQRSPDGVETHARWLAVADWLPEAPELHDWRELAAILQRLASTQPEDPVAALVTFLKENSFNLKFAALRLNVPDDAPAPRLRPDGNLAIYLLVGEAKTALVFVPRGDGNRDPIRRITVYTFVPQGSDRLTFSPGNQLWAELELRDETNKRWKLSWLQCRSTLVYSFKHSCGRPGSILPRNVTQPEAHFPRIFF